ncbi:Zn-ribbon domain-containing OB-fold protein [Nocardia stercoris]|uniref:DUF35 domain-containing protein n=1 Tax=Nocardia stercoris TaxID=2483361 RepID=A0A3M2L5K1_9NOCA|nr:OB-fold domain-containing protein [Nocardia stercoris]RMI32246.1 hypothetical protein EBN03_14750 [Nocardia stercoris]
MITSELDTNTSAAVAPRAEDQVLIRRCAACDKLYAPPTDSCSSCASRDLESVPSCGAGSIVSWRVVDRDPTGVNGGQLLTIAIVELDEGPWVYTCIDGEVPASADGPVRVQFQPRPHDDRFPVFEVAPTPNSLVAAALS